MLQIVHDVAPGAAVLRHRAARRPRLRGQHPRARRPEGPVRRGRDRRRHRATSTSRSSAAARSATRSTTSPRRACTTSPRPATGRPAGLPVAAADRRRRHGATAGTNIDLDRRRPGALRRRLPRLRRRAGAGHRAGPRRRRRRRGTVSSTSSGTIRSTQPAAARRRRSSGPPGDSPPPQPIARSRSTGTAGPDDPARWSTRSPPARPTSSSTLKDPDGDCSRRSTPGRARSRSFNAGGQPAPTRSR